LGWRANTYWTNASTAVKEGVLKAAARLMDLLPYEAQKSDVAQARRFPSSNMTNSSGTLYIPEQLKEAQCILGLALLEDPSIESGDTDPQSISVSGSFSINYGASNSGGLSLIERLPLGFLERMKPWLMLYGPNPGGVWMGPNRTFK